MTTILAAGFSTDEPNRGWAGPIALVAAFAFFWLVIRPIYLRYRKIDNPSPPPGEVPEPTVTPQDQAGSDPRVTEETGWWGRVVERGGQRYRTFRHIAATGDSPAHSEPRDDEIDLDLDVELEPIEEWIAKADVPGVVYNDLVRTGVRSYGVSAATVKRRIREHRERTGRRAA